MGLLPGEEPEEEQMPWLEVAQLEPEEAALLGLGAAALVVPEGRASHR